MVVIFGL